MGLFGFLRKNDERAMPEPGTPEFEAAVAGTAIPDAQSVSMGEPGWTKPGASQRIDLRGTGHRAQIAQVLREHGIDPDKKGQTVDASQVPGLREALLKALFRAVPNSSGIDGGVSAPKKSPPADSSD